MRRVPIIDLLFETSADLLFDFADLGQAPGLHLGNVALRQLNRREADGRLLKVCREPVLNETVTISLPASQIEVGGEGGQEALARLKQTFSRVKSS